MSVLALPAHRHGGTHRRGAICWSEALAGLALALLFALAHPFAGIEHDARIYMARALADLDPDGVGRDIMFTMDGQSSFSIFRFLAKEAVATFGLARTVLLLSLANIVAWLVAIAALARVLLPGRAIVLGLAAACVLSTLYAPWQLFMAGESFPVPRPLAEAAVLLAMAALCRGRALVALALLLVAALLHPIMALPGFGVLLVVLGVRDRRWLVAAGLAGAALVAAAWLGLPLVSRLMVQIDAVWRAILVERTPYLFVGLWPLADAPASVLVRAVTIVVACTWIGGTARIVLLGSLAVGLAGVAISFVLGDLASSQLILQAQLWRALWLSAAMAPLAAGLCLWRLSERGPIGQITLAFLTVAWVCLDWVPVAPIAAVLALAAHVGGRRLSIRLDRLAVLVWLACAGLVALELWVSLGTLAAVVRSLPPGVPVGGTIAVKAQQLHVATLPVMLLAAAWWRWHERAGARFGAAVVVAVAALLLATQWDARDAAETDIDAATPKPDLAAILATHPGPVLWLGGNEAPYWLGRPNWSGDIQGSGIVFSRDLALEWHRRAEAVIEAGLSTPHTLRPYASAPPFAAPRLDAARLGAFCRGFHGADAGAPAWIVSPLDPDSAVPTGLGIGTWSLPMQRWTLVVGGDALHWRRLDRYAVIPCATRVAGMPR